MNENLTIITHQGKKILLANLADKKEQEILDAIEDSYEIMTKNKINLMILDVRNTNTTKAIREKSVEVFKRVEEQIGKVYSSLIGLRLAQQILANTINNDQCFSSSIDEAKDWLAKK